MYLVGNVGFGVSTKEEITRRESSYVTRHHAKLVIFPLCQHFATKPDRSRIHGQIHVGVLTTDYTNVDVLPYLVL